MIQNDIKTNFVTRGKLQSIKESLKLNFAFKNDNYTIVKIIHRYVDKFKTREARWKIEGDINLF